MIKEKLMTALKDATTDYNGGLSANAAVVKAAEAHDFNEHQTERLVEMFNTLAALNKEKDASDPTGSCELASKDEVAKMLLESSTRKAASAGQGTFDPSQYLFYSSTPEKTNLIIEARETGKTNLMKAAFASEEIPDELNVSQRSLFKAINRRIALLKSAGDAADDVVRGLNLEIERSAVKIAKAIESPFASSDVADMFKAVCQHSRAVDEVARYSTKVAESNGGIFSTMAVVDSAKIDDLLKTAGDIEDYMSKTKEYEQKRDFYLGKAAEYEQRVATIVRGVEEPKKESLADFFKSGAHVKVAHPEASNEADGNGVTPDVSDAKLSVKIAELLRKSNVSGDGVSRLIEDLEKDAAPVTTRLMPTISVPAGDAADALVKSRGLSDEKTLLLNVRRGILLDDLMVNDPIIRDADPNKVIEIYKTIIASSPRISLDKAMVRSVLRSAVNSIAISPSDAKVLTDVDRGVAMSNIERLTNLDSSIKDSNKV